MVAQGDEDLLTNKHLFIVQRNKVKAIYLKFQKISVTIVRNPMAVKHFMTVWKFEISAHLHPIKVFECG